MKVAFEPAARDDLDRIYDWIANQNPRAATELIARIETKVMRLENRELMHMGRPGLVEGTRELLEWPYMIVYKVDEVRQEVVVVSVAHGAQDRDSEAQQGLHLDRPEPQRPTQPVQDEHAVPGGENSLQVRGV